MANIFYLLFTLLFSFFFCLPVFSPLHPPQSTFPLYNIVDYGAIPDGQTINTKIFEELIDQIVQHGGGTIYIPEGRFLTAPFDITSNLTIFLDAGAVLLATDDQSLWPLLSPLPSYGQGRDHFGPRHASLIYGENVKNVVITGNNGTIEGQGAVWWKGYQDGTELHTRGSLIEFLYSQDILISHITLQNSPFWNIHPYSSSNIILQNLTILAPIDSPNTDGIVPDSSSNVLIENSYIATGDDAVAIKSGWDCFGVWYNTPSSNIYIRNITVFTPNGIGLAIGSEMSGGIENIVIENSKFIEVKEAFRIKSNEDRSGYVQNIIHQNITIFKAKTGIMIDLTYRDRNPSCKINSEFPLPILKNLNYISIKGGEVETAGKLHGLINSPIQDLLLQNVTWTKFDQSYSCSNVFGLNKRKNLPTSCF